ncbi:DUF1259 domain-containing protein [Pendulispora albinea]|uniref:DUF1259 domain-containing protein n=1 Tax=Pendulispora albinea TaxID=2741071 RepID=A0ABZ2M4S6_9BACT
MMTTRGWMGPRTKTRAKTRTTCDLAAAFLLALAGCAGANNAPDAAHPSNAANANDAANAPNTADSPAAHAAATHTTGSHPAATQTTAATTHDYAPVARVFGKQGKPFPGGLYKFEFPRTDLKLTVRGLNLSTSLTHTTSFIFYPMSDGKVMVMSDFVTTESEAQAVMSKLVGSPVRMSAMHKHLLSEEPRLLWIHLMAEGDQVEIARMVHGALGQTGALGAPAPKPIEHTVDGGKLDRILGGAGVVDAGVRHYLFPRKEAIKMRGMAVPSTFGAMASLRFQPTGGGKAAINGDFSMLADEVQGVVDTLRQHGIEIAELHHHDLWDEPRLFYLHFWAHDDAEKLARALRAALDKTNVGPT